MSFCWETLPGRQWHRDCCWETVYLTDSRSVVGRLFTCLWDCCWETVYLSEGLLLGDCLPVCGTVVGRLFTCLKDLLGDCLPVCGTVVGRLFTCLWDCCWETVYLSVGLLLGDCLPVCGTVVGRLFTCLRDLLGDCLPVCGTVVGRLFIVQSVGLLFLMPGTVKVHTFVGSMQIFLCMSHRSWSGNDNNRDIEKHISRIFTIQILTPL